MMLGVYFVTVFFNLRMGFGWLSYFRRPDLSPPPDDPKLGAGIAGAGIGRFKVGGGNKFPSGGGGGSPNEGGGGNIPPKGSEGGGGGNDKLPRLGGGGGRERFDKLGGGGGRVDEDWL